MKKWLIVGLFAVAAAAVTYRHSSLRNSHLAWTDLITFNARPPGIGILAGDPLQRLGLKSTDPAATDAGRIRYVGKTRYLNNARAVVTHTIDDTTKYVVDCLDTMDKYGIKSTVFVSTQKPGMSRLWPRLRQAIADGHEIGSHSRRHQCQWPDTFFFCFRAYTDYEIIGSRDDILANTRQPHVWSWCYPCGNCSRLEFVHRKLARAGYLVARNYPGEKEGKHLVPNLQTYAPNPYDASYTQAVQKKGGIAPAGRTEVSELNSKFDEVYEHGGIYHFLSHPQWLDYGPEAFYERHLTYIGRRADIWYVPLGPLHTYRTMAEKSEVRRLPSQDGAERFAVYNRLDPKIFGGSITLEFSVPHDTRTQVLSHGKPLVEQAEALTDRWDTEYVRREDGLLFVTIHPNTILELRTVSQ